MASSLLPLLWVPSEEKLLGQRHVCLFTYYEVQHQQQRSLGYDKSPKWTLLKKGLQLFCHSKGKGESNLTPKRKIAPKRKICFIWEDDQEPPKKSTRSFSCEWQRGVAASHAPAARGWRVNVGAGSHRKTQLPFPDHTMNANAQQAERD